MLEDIKATHACCFNGTYLAKHQHGKGAHRHRQLRVVIGAADTGFARRSLQLPTASVPRTQFVRDLEGKGAFYTVASQRKGAFDIDDAGEQSIA